MPDIDVAQLQMQVDQLSRIVNDPYFGMTPAQVAAEREDAASRGIPVARMRALIANNQPIPPVMTTEEIQAQLDEVNAAIAARAERRARADAWRAECHAVMLARRAANAAHAERDADPVSDG
ncbi:MAG: hypothetical protein J2P17_08680 [Mycobacterium sp.]|nr:hypothetical protein [Mycobacterium sp.]